MTISSLRKFQPQLTTLLSLLLLLLPALTVNASSWFHRSEGKESLDMVA